MKTIARSALVAVAATLTLAACGTRSTDENAGSNEDAAGQSSSAGSPSASSTASQSPDFKACMVSDSAGFSDKSFNETSLEGQTDAAAQYGVQTAQVESTSDNQYADNINELVAQKCNEITSVGYLLGDATLAAAKANPSIDFAIVDYAYSNAAGKNTAPSNLQGLTFDTAEPSYLAGYLAAGMTKSGIVGTFGGQNIPTVTAYMEGFRQGILAYNAANSANVKLLGWDGKNGSFTDDFESKTKGQNVGEQLTGQGADIIFPVAGGAGLGGLQAAKDAGAKAIWVDTDGYTSTDYGDILLTSAEKGLDTPVTTAIKSAIDGTFSNTPYVGTLANGGVGLAPYHDFANQIPQALQDKIAQLKQQIIAGTLTVPGS